MIELLQRWDAAIALGTAYDFGRRAYPDNLYESLDRVASLRISGRVGSIVVCGAAAMKDLEDGKQPPTTEAFEMRRYLMEEHAIPPDDILTDDRSTNTPENFENFIEIAQVMAYESACLPIPDTRAARVNLLAQKICWGICDVDVRSFEASDADFPFEPKLFGDQSCALQDVAWGTYMNMPKPEDETRWNYIRKQHQSCPYYQPSSPQAAQDRTNYHPPELMASFDSPPRPVTSFDV